MYQPSNRPDRRRRASVLAAAVSASLFASSTTNPACATNATWLDHLGGYWTDPTKWSTNPVYPNNDTPTVGTTYDVKLFTDSGGWVLLDHDITIDNLTFQTFTTWLIQTAGTLHVNNPINIGSALYEMQGNCTLLNTTVNTASDGIFRVRENGNPTLDGVTIAGVGINWNPALQILNGLTLNNGEFHLGSVVGAFSKASFIGTQTLGGTGTVYFDNDPTGSKSLEATSGTLTIGPNIVVQPGSAEAKVGAGSAGQLLNQGTIIAVTHPATLFGSWSNVGTLKAAGAKLTLGGNFSTAGIGSVIQTSGSVELGVGTLDNTGATLQLNATTGSWKLNGITINGGRLEAIDGTSYSTIGNVVNTSILQGVTLGAPLTVSGRLRMLGGLVLDQSTGGVLATSSTAHFEFNGTQTLGGSGEVQLNGGFLDCASGGSGVLTFGPNVAVRVASSGGIIGGSGTGTFLNQGTIKNEASSATLEIKAPITNQGLIRVAGGAILILPINATNPNTGTVQLDGPNTILALSGNDVTEAAIGTFTRSNGGNLRIDGRLVNTGSTIALNAFQGGWSIGRPNSSSFAAIDGGTVVAGGSIAELPITGNTSFLNGVALNTNARLGGGLTLQLFDGFTLNGDLDVLGGGQTPTQVSTNFSTALAGSGRIIFDNSATTSTARLVPVNAPLILGNGITVMTGTGSGSIGNAVQAAVTNNGTISARTAGKNIALLGNFTNQGTIDSTVAGSNLSTSGAFTNNSNGMVSITSGSTFTASGTLTLAGGSVGGDGAVVSTGTTSITDDVFHPGRGVLRARGAFSIAAGKKLDLNEGRLILAGNSVGSLVGSTYTGTTGLIQSGRNGGAWNGAGIVTSRTDATRGNFTSLGIATAAQAKGVAATATAVWSGQTVTGNDTLVMYTYGGDANLDGKINVDDYGRIDFNIPRGVAGWFNGDFNYDGKINVDDYGIIDFNVGIQGAPFSTGASAEAGGASLSGVAAIPEPARGASVMMLTVGLLGSGRRSKKV